MLIHEYEFRWPPIAARSHHPDPSSIRGIPLVATTLRGGQHNGLEETSSAAHRKLRQAYRRFKFRWEFAQDQLV